MTRRHFFFSFSFLYLGIFQESELSEIQSETKMKETFFSRFEWSRSAQMNLKVKKEEKNFLLFFLPSNLKQGKHQQRNQNLPNQTKVKN